VRPFLGGLFEAMVGRLRRALLLDFAQLSGDMEN
jgi:hypothetical protein